MTTPNDASNREPTARFMLACKHCGERWPDNTVMEAVKLHFEVEHDTDQLVLDLIVVCSCNTTMNLIRTDTTKTGFRDHFKCPSDGYQTSIPRTS